mgnify:CR=1
MATFLVFDQSKELYNKNNKSKNMKSLLLMLPLLFTFSLLQLGSVTIPKHFKTSPIQLSEVVVYPTCDTKYQPIVLPEVTIHAHKLELKTIKFSPYQLPEVIVIG